MWRIIMSKYFGTDGFRGEAGKVLTADHAYKIGRYLGWYYGKEHKGRIVIGKDTRRSSYMFEYALVAGITASGSDAYLLHVTTTPSVAYVVRTEEFDCGIMVSASHNPYNDNGIKLEDFFKNVSFHIDNYKRSCKKYNKNSLYLLIDATDSDDNVTSYRVPLSLTDSCDAQP